MWTLSDALRCNPHSTAGLKIKHVWIIGIFCLLTACSPSATTTSQPPAANPIATPIPSATPRPRTYPLLPLPPGAIFYRPEILGDDLAVMEMEILGNPDPPFTPEQYSTLFERYGWTRVPAACGRSGLSTPVPTMTDTAELGMYAYGTSADAPRVCLSKNTLAEDSHALTLHIYHCGMVKAHDPKDASPSNGCRIIVEEK